MGRCKKQPHKLYRQNKKYTEQQLFSAVQAVRNGSTQCAAAKKFSVPRSTLFNKITGKTLMGKKPGPKTVLLAEEEQTIEKWVFGLAVRGFPVTKRQLLRSIQLYLNINKRKTIFNNNLPGRKWYNAFRDRHPRISEKLSQNLTVRRAAVTADKIKVWRSEILQYCEEHDLMETLNDPSRVFNMDEKGFVLTPNNEVVLVQRGDKAVYSRSKNDEKECVSALLGGSASGVMTPPMIIHSYKRMPAAVLINNPAKCSVGISDSGWQTQQTFHDYIANIFYKWLLAEKIQLPVIVFIDGHKSHVSLTLSDFCADHKIELIALYPNSTHLTQPMDVGVFKPLSVSWTNHAKDWRIDNQYAKIEKKDVAPILERAINAIKYSKHLQKAFKKSGIFPFDVDNIDLSRVLPSVAQSASQQEQLWTHQEEQTLTSTGTVTNAAVDRLQHFEQLMGATILNSFRASSKIWTGAKEYSVLFQVWTQMYREASESMSEESQDEAIVVEVVHGMSTDTNQCVNSHSTETQIVDNQFVIDDGDWIMEELDASIDEMDTTVFMFNDVTGHNVKILEQCISLDNNATEDPNNSSSDSENIIIHEDVTTNEQCSIKEIGHSTVTDAIVESTVCDPKPVKSCATFSPDAFKEAFFWPSEGDRKTTKSKMSPKISSVMSSEDWREHERLKLEEKQKLQAEKDARKAAREAKKLESAKMAAEKLVLKEQKLAAANIAAETKTNPNKRSRKATIKGKKLKK